MSRNARNYQAQHVNTAGLRNPGGQVGGSTWPSSGITSWVNGNKSNDKIFHPTQWWHSAGSADTLPSAHVTCGPCGFVKTLQEALWWGRSWGWGGRNFQHVPPISKWCVVRGPLSRQPESVFSSLHPPPPRHEGEQACSFTAHVGITTLTFTEIK